MNSRSTMWLLAAVFASAVTLAPLAACGPAKGKCSTSNCSGCCDADGECQAGNTFAACGTSGASCTLCGSGTACELGICRAVGGSGGGGGSTGGGGGSMDAGTGGGGGSTGGGGGSTGGGGGSTGGGGGSTGGGGGSTGGGGGSTGGGGGSTGGGGGATDGGMVTTTPLTSGMAITIAGGLDTSTFYTIDIPTGAAALNITTSGGTGDVDLYLRYGQPPTLTESDYGSEEVGNAESITVTSPDAGTWYLEAFGYEAYSGVTMTATW